MLLNLIIIISFAELEIEPVSLRTLIKYLPNRAQTNNFIRK